MLVLRGSQQPVLTSAIEARQAIEAGDATALFPHLYGPEVRAMQLTPQKVQHFMDEIYMPRLRKYRKTSDVEERVGGSGSQGISMRDYVSSKGQILPAGSATLLTADGGKMLFTDLVIHAWAMEHFDDPARVWNRRAQNEVILAGLAADRARLEAIGIPGRYAWPPGGGFLTWDELEARCRKRLAEAIAAGD